MTRTDMWKASMVIVFLIAGPLVAQTRPPAQPPQTPPLLPPGASAARPATPAPVPFPADAKVGYINMQNVFGDSVAGKKGPDQVKALSDRLDAGLAARDKEMQGLADKIKTQQGVVNMQTWAGWNKDLQRLQREAQFAQQEAQVQINQLQQDLLDNFQTQVQPVVEALRAEKGLWIVFAVGTDAGGVSIAAAHPGLDLSTEVAKRLNATSGF